MVGQGDWRRSAGSRGVIRRPEMALDDGQGLGNTELSSGDDGDWERRPWSKRMTLSVALSTC